MMPIIVGNPITVGGKLPAFVGWLRGSGTNSGSYTTKGTWEVIDSGRASVSSNQLSVSKAGSYTVYYQVRGGYNNSGSTITCYYRIYAGGTAQVTSSTGNAAAASSFTVTLSEGDTIYIQTYNSGTSSNTHNFTVLVMRES